MARANNVSLNTNLNTHPYYDDFDETKGYYRILYRPGLAVQSRELTQQSSILQNQIDRFASHIFEEGSRVKGGEMFFDNHAHYIKLRDNDLNNLSVNAASFVGSILTGNTTGVKALVVDSFDGAEANTPNTKTLYIKYTQSSSNGTQKYFLDGEIVNSNTNLSANLLSSSATGTGLRITLGEGIIYSKDHFVYVPEQSIVVGKYTINASARFGYDVTETIVTESTDETLLDPASGSYNYSAPGAARLSLSATLTKKDLSEKSTSNFVEMGRINNGILVDNGTKPKYSEIRDYLARRTFDESGNYVVNGYTVRLKEHLKSGNNLGVYTSSEGGNSSMLCADTSPGKAYVTGYDVENLISRCIPVRKSTDYEDETDIPVPANYGNYITVDNLVGNWDLNTQSRVSLRSTQMNAVSNGDFSSTSATGAEIGTARVRALVYSSGTPGSPSARYKMYLYDVNMTANSFAYARSVYYNGSTADGKADIVLSSGNAAISETKFNKAIFKLPASNIRRLRDSSGTIDNDFRFYKSFDLTLATDGTATISTGASDELFPYSAGALNATQKRNGFHLVFNDFANTGALTGTVSTTNASNTIVGVGTSFDSHFNVGDRIKVGGHSNTFTVSEITNSTSLKTLEAAGKATTANVYFKEFPIGHVVDLGGNGSDGSGRGVTVVSGLQSASVDIDETLQATASATVIVDLNKSNGREMSKLRKANRLVQICTSNNAGSTTGPWDLGFSDVYKINSVRIKGSAFSATNQGSVVTSKFTLDTGQKDNIYKHSKLKIKPGASLSISNGDYLLVNLDYFDHDTSSGIGYFSVDSYPIDDVNGSANTNAIYTQEIPIYVSPTSGERYSLRDCIDIRPRVTDTATDATVIGSATLNPAGSNTITTIASGLHYSVPNENFTVDLSYYLKRKDIITLSREGIVRVVEGQPALKPITPPEPDDALVLAKIEVAPYPSLPPELSRQYDRPSLSCAVFPVRHPRFTMRDIGVLRDRVDRLEYYTSLSLLEKDAKELLIADANGNDRFKNGILVDAFTGHNIGNVYDTDYAISIDRQSGEARPPFKIENVKMDYASANSSGVARKASDVTLSLTNVTGTFSNNETVTAGAATGVLRYHTGSKLYLEQTSGTFVANTTATGGTSGATGTISTISTPTDGDLVMLSWKHDLFQSQPYASTTRNAAPAAYSFVGSMTLDPEIDYWVDTTRRPDVQVNFDLNYDNWQTLANAWQTEWGDWETIWTGQRETDNRTVSNGTTVVGNQIIESFTTVQTLEITEQQRRRGVAATVVPETQQQRLGERLVDVNLIPVMRSREVKFTVNGLKPNTRVYPFFDNVDVSSYVTPANSSFANTANEGHKLITDSTGNLYGTFRIPNDGTQQFRVGDRKFRVTDNPTNSTDFGATTTAADAIYSATGLVQTTQDTVISTRSPQFSFDTVMDESTTVSTRSVSSPGGTRVVGTFDFTNVDDWGGGDGGGDPLAQSFKVADLYRTGMLGPGIFLTKIDLFFNSKHSNLPVIVEIREVDPSTGYVTNRVVPFGRATVESSDVNISTDASAPTPFVFPSPVFLRQNEYYAFVVKPGGGNGDYSVWVSKLGENDIETGNRIATQAIETGMLFASANDRTWTAIQDEDIKYNLYCCDFTNPSSGTAVLKNESLEMFSVANVSSSFEDIGEIIHGETTLSLSSSPTINTGTYASGGNSSANGVVTYVSGSTVRVKGVTLSNKYSNGETITFLHPNGLSTSQSSTLSSQATPSGKLSLYDPRTASNTWMQLSNTSGTFVANTWIRGQKNGYTGRIVSLENFQSDVMNVQLPGLQLVNTSISYTAKLATSTSTRDSSFFKINNMGDNEFNSARYILGKSNESTGISGDKSVEFRASLSSNHRRLSPTIDLARSNIISVENLINNDSTGETGNGGNAKARYISRQVTLADGQDAEDLKVFLSAYKPSTATIKVYARYLHAEDSDDFNDRGWVELTQSTSSTIVSDDTNTLDAKEYEYTIPSANLTGDNGEVQYTNSEGVTFTGYKYFAVKVVLLSTNTAKPPRLRDLRAIALQI